MSSNESNAFKIMQALDVDYVLVIFGGVIGYSGDDINKFLWMVRIAEGEHPKDIRVSEIIYRLNVLFSLLLMQFVANIILNYHQLCAVTSSVLKQMGNISLCSFPCEGFFPPFNFFFFTVYC